MKFSGPKRLSDKSFVISTEPSAESLQDCVKNHSQFNEFFSDILREIEVDMKLMDYHMKVINLPHKSSFSVEVYYGRNPPGPLKVERCMSCDLDCPLSLGVFGKNLGGPSSRDALILETGHNRVWFDAKARPMFIVTPKEHYQRLSELSPAGLYDMFKSAMDVLETMNCSFATMIINHGSYRNHAHLHMKIKVPVDKFNDAMKQWPSELQRKYETMRIMLNSNRL